MNRIAPNGKCSTHAEGLLPQEETFVGPWQLCVRITNVLCSDGVQRSARTRIPDSFFSIPASVKVKGKTVTGFIMRESNGVYYFHAMKKKPDGSPYTNAHLLPGEFLGTLEQYEYEGL